MRVTHVADNISHAVISSGKAMDFGISNSAEFFNILSNTLYSDKILAGVREVLCNGWDIHIQTGRTDVPVEVTLADGKLTIRDHGTGISKEDIHPIYAVYGNSTKKLDGQQTGGFGLGSKAPFAYVDHFEVTSFHKGTKTVYAVSKSSAEVAGKPSIMPLVSVPCGDESGLMVSFSVKPEDRRRFEDVINMIAKFGEMNVTLNGTRKLPTIPFSQAKHGFLMTKEVAEIPGAANHKIFARYGNVVYPVPDHEKFKVQYHKVVEIVDRVSHNKGNYYSNSHTPYKIIFQAQPDTISVTPSRESLSMTDHTVESISGLFAAFLTLTERELQQACVDAERECIEATWRAGQAVRLLTSDNKVPELFDDFGKTKTVIEAPVITDVPSMARTYLSRTYPDFPNFRNKDIEMRLEVLEKAGIGGPKNRDKIQSFRRERAEHGNVNDSPWFQRVLVAPLMKRLDEVPELSGRKLLVYGDHKDLTTDRNGRYRNTGEGRKFVEAAKLSKRNLDDYLPFLRNIVVISFNRIDVEERLPSFPVMKENVWAYDFFLYVVSRADKKIDIVRKFFADQGMTVIDLTVRQPWEHEDVLVPVPKGGPTVKKPRKKGLPKLSALLGTDRHGHECLRYAHYQPSEGLDAIERTESPQFVVQFNPRAQSANMLDGVDEAAKRAVVRLYGDLGGVVVNDNQYSRFTQELKIPALSVWLLAKMKEEVTINPRLQLAFGFDHEKLPNQLDRMAVQGSYSKQQILKLILQNPELAIEFGVLNDLTEEDRLVLTIVESLCAHRNWNWRHDKTVEEMRKHIQGVQPTPEVEAIAALVANSDLVDAIDINHFSRVFGDKPTASQKAQRSGCLDILQYVLA